MTRNPAKFPSLHRWKTTPTASAAVASRNSFSDAATPPCGDARRGIIAGPSLLSHCRLLFIFLFVGVFVLLGFFGGVRTNIRLNSSFIGTAAVLLVWAAILFASAWHKGRILTLEFVPRPQHYLQACLQIAIYAYWGWY